MASINSGINNMDNLEGYAPRKGETACRLPNGWTEITTPYLDCHNDYIQIYFKSVDDGFFLLADGGSTLSLLDEGGVSGAPKWKRMLNTTLARYGVTEQNGNLQVKATADDFAPKKRSLVQAILFLNSLFGNYN